ncbi:MAG: hypothetical protein COB22_04550 [Cycloclasticus sp.]|nr:MAG: hypothetical protein COB22_04550 [Cycloclasticus sp.]
MITKITKIKNLGLFNDYSADAALLDFKKFNLLYGWNGTGKTTLSELFTAFNDGALKDYPSLEYQFKADGQTYSQNTPYDKNIRVFNQKYIAENVDVISGSAKSIFILGKENKDLIEVIKQDEKILNGDPEKEGDLGKIKELFSKEQELKTKEKEKNTKFTDVARIISANTSGVSARNYNKGNAERAFNQLKNTSLLSKEEIQQNSTTLKQQQKSTLTLINTDITKNIEQIILDSRSVLEKTVETVIIERLKEHADISLWVENGIKLHKEKESTTCEFCNQPLPESRIPDLLSYFNDADKALKTEIDILLDKIRQLYSSIDKLSILDKANLYDEFQISYEAAIKEVNHHKTDLLSKVEDLGKKVKDKKQHTTEKLTLTISIDDSVFLDAMITANSFITACNAKTNSFTKTKAVAEKKLENHYLSEIHDDIEKLTKLISSLETDIQHLNSGNPDKDDEVGIQSIQDRIVENKTKVSASGTACDEINKQLQTFLGRNELSFEVVEEGYIIKRKGKPAKNLSEGEKTAIAFVYFTIHLQDQDFDIQNGIIVIDDPISSMDSNSIFQAFSFLKNAVKGAQQIFILTHNFDFLKLILGWLKRMPSKFYMIKNSYNESNDRVARIEPLDKLLTSYNSEYQYLFNLLSNFSSDGTIASVYHIPNIARKTLEYFLMIMIPNSDKMFSKMEQLDFDETKKTAIYKFTNDQSHITGGGFDPSLVPECQNNVKYLLEMIEKLFPAHYKILMECNQ